MAIRVGQTAFSGGVMTQSVVGRSDLEKYSLSLALATNAIISKSGSLMNRPGTIFVGEVYDSSQAARLVPFQFSTTQTYVGEITDSIWRPIMEGGQILEAAQNVVSITQANPGVVTITGHAYSNGDKVFPFAIGGMTEVEDGRVFTVANVTTDTFTLVDLWGDAVDTTDYTAFTSGGTFSRLYKLAFPYDASEVFEIDYAQTADTMYLTHLDYTPRKLTRSGHASWSVSAVTFGPTLASPTSPAAVAAVGSGATTYRYKITAIDDDTGEESLPSSVASCTNDLTVAGNANTVSWTAVSGAERYIVYKEDNGVYGLIGGTEGVSFSDTNYLPDLGDTPPQARDPFSSTGNKPAVCEFHEGRLVYGQTLNIPGGVWLSVSNRYDNFNVSTPAKADDSVSFDLRPGVNAVNGLLSLKKLCIFTADGEWTAEGGGVTQFITPSSLVTTLHTRRGSKRLQPIAVGDIGLYVQRQGAIIRAFGYSFEKDGFRSNDLTLLAPEFFKGYTIVDWCYQQEPESVVWCVRSDGALLALTFVEEQNTFAWTICYLGGASGDLSFGAVESCCAIEGDTQDDVYLVVNRTINGETKRYIEQLAPRWRPEYGFFVVTNIAEAYFLDSGISYRPDEETSIVPGLWHLEGLEVMALVDGSVQGPFDVEDGKITLSTPIQAGGVAHVGLSYATDVVDLPLAQETQTGARAGKRTGVNAVVLKLNASRGMKVGKYAAGPDKLVELKSRHLEDYDDPTQPYNGDTKPIAIDDKWDLLGSVWIRQEAPLPLELLGIYKDVSVGG